MKNNWIVFLGIAALCTVFASGAMAGCGHAVPSNLSVALQQIGPQDQTRADQVMAEGLGLISLDQSPNSAPVVGLWFTNVTVGGQPFGQGFESFSAEGLEVLNDNGPPQAGNVCLGIWVPIGRNSVKVKHPSWNYDNSGNVIGTVVIRSQITLDNSGNTFKGTVTVDIYDMNGNSVAPQIKGQIAGKRITVD